MTKRRFATLLSLLAVGLMTTASPAAADFPPSPECIVATVENALEGEATACTTS